MVSAIPLPRDFLYGTEIFHFLIGNLFKDSLDYVLKHPEVI
jgi:hypothetical protein